MPERLRPRRQGVYFLMTNLEREAYDAMFAITYSFNDYYGISYLKKDQYDIAVNALKKLENSGLFTRRELELAKWLFKTQHGNEKKIKDLINSEPRTHAQRFIGKKKIRNFIFQRDKVCLRCGLNKRLTIDHIVSIKNGGENKISNLQCLCLSCNSSKSDKYFDFREGSRCVLSKKYYL